MINSPTRTPHGRAVRELLSDGEWHDRGEVIAHAAPYVPAVIAVRRGHRVRETDLRSYRKVRGIPETQPVRDRGRRMDVQVVGARNLVMGLLHKSVQTGRIEKDTTEDGTIRYRLAR